MADQNRGAAFRALHQKGNPFILANAWDIIKAAAAAARALPGDFVLVARADCVYVPLPGTMADQERVCKATTLPVNALAAGPFTSISRANFAKAGVAGISLGSALARVTHRVNRDASEAMFEDGDFTMLGAGMQGDAVDALLRQ
ncbi:isocitrate lyase/phosphoenolpyruvate mutase family protein [uncultured Aliiroseovarius sp.]|uniref:isocitrate lyase/phosphoenolpyruvate mutase family protein n=1 Tax=uncultured Aliiroseovarius sp. TaxID=1658783 RepID=UPI0025959B17|nr:isocitrate lyase/phosphoenolpyruvate mutase family protein [uncultured Aliiroseovarius sp.]